MQISEIGEFGLIHRIQKKWIDSGVAAPVLIGIGDDAAATRPTPGKALLLTTDILIEQVHFDRSFSTLFQVGYKAVSVNASDIAAMGGHPLYFLVSLGVSGAETVADIDQLYRGMRQASLPMNISLVGGNTTHSPRLFVSLTLIGEAPPKEIITRSGGDHRDLLYVTGTLGDAAAGLEILQNRDRKRDVKAGNRRPDWPSLIRRHLVPRARLQEGRLLAKKKIPSAMIDLSDGLSSDLSHLANQSGVGAELDLENIPLSYSLRRYAKIMGVDPLSYALHGGEDYELLFSVPKRNKGKMDALINQGSIAARCIGRLVEKKSGLLVKDADGSVRPLKSKGYDHFGSNNS